MNIDKYIENYYVESRGPWLNFLSRALQCDFSAEDVLHNSFEAAIKYKDTYKGEEKDFAAWFSRILFNQLSLYRRKRSGFGYNEPDIFLEAEDLIYTLENYSDVSRKTEALPIAEHREVVNLFFIQGYSCREINTITNYSLSHIKLIVKRFRDDLRPTLRS